MRDLVETVIDQILSREKRLTMSESNRQRLQRSPHTRAGQSGRFASARPIHPPASQRDEKLWQACCQFEAIFLQQMLAAMRKSVPKSSLLPQGFTQDVQASMLDQAIAEAGSKQGILGIARTLYRQVEQTRGHEIQENPALADRLDMEDRRYAR